MMKYAADFRAIARNALRGKWPTAILTGFIASLIGAEIFTGGGGGSSNNDSDSIDTIFRQLQNSDAWPLICTVLIIAAIILVVWAITAIVISGAGKLGYARFNLNLIDGKEATLGDLFSQFDRLGTGFCMNLLVGLYTALWSLLFVIPGIVKSFSYALTPYILAEHPEMTVNEAITESRRIMPGNRWRLFCLDISFIGWGLLCLLPPLIAVIIGVAVSGISGSFIPLLLMILLAIPLSAGYLFLQPYMEAAFAAFYRDVSGTTVSASPLLDEPAPGYSQYTQSF